jgi:hypothetical protein
MPYKVRIRRNSDNLIRTYDDDLDWHDSSMFWWTEGNAGCDCNRALFFARAVDEDEPDWDNIPCGDKLYTVLDITLEDGRVIEVDAPVA